MNSDQKRALWATLEQAGPAKVRKAITSGRWPTGEVRDLTEGWLLIREVAEQKSKRGAWFAPTGTADDVRVLTQDASTTAHAALDAAEESNRNSKVGYLIAALALALAFVSL